MANAPKEWWTSVRNAWSTLFAWLGFDVTAAVDEVNPEQGEQGSSGQISEATRIFTAVCHGRDRRSKARFLS